MLLRQSPQTWSTQTRETHAMASNNAMWRRSTSWMQLRGQMLIPLNTFEACPNADFWALSQIYQRLPHECKKFVDNIS